MLRFVYSDGGLYRAFMVLRLMYSDGGLCRAYRAFMVLRFMYDDGGLRVFPSGGRTGGTLMSSMSPLITAVSPHKIQKLSPPIFADQDKNFLDIFQSLHGKG